jgi:hypothetical protein
MRKASGRSGRNSQYRKRRSLDLAADPLANPRRFRILTLVEEFTREC